jgi:hypothetical protein
MLVALRWSVPVSSNNLTAHFQAWTSIFWHWHMHEPVHHITRTQYFIECMIGSSFVTSKHV